MANRTNDFSKPIPIADGGTAATTAAGARTNLGITIGARTIEGTLGQVDVNNGSGLLGNPVISLATDTVMPGTGATTVSRGTSAEYPGAPVEGMIRGNTDTGFTEVYSNGSWRPQGRDIVGTPNQIDVADGDGIAGDPTLSISDDVVLPGTGAATMPIGTTAERHATPVNGMVRANTDTNFYEIYSNGAWRPQGRVLQGTVNQIDISNGDGIAADPTLSISDDAIFPGTGAITVPSGTTAERPGVPVVGMIRANTDTNQIEAYSSGAWGGFNFIRNYLTGFTHTVASVTTISFSSGQCTNNANTSYLVSNSSFTKTINAVWSAGTGNGGRASAIALSNNTVYYTFIISKTDGTVDFGFDTSISATNLLTDAGPSGFVYYRRIGSCRTQSASTNLETIYQIGDYFYYQTQKKDYTVALGAAGTTNVTIPLSVPTGINSIINLMASSERYSIGSGTTRIFVMPTTTTGIADNYLSHIHETSSGANEAEGVANYQIPSNDGQVRVYSVLSGGAAGNTYISTFGWYDPRGR